jgi:glycosyltransferase involved in cell wall biosynthesis
MDMKASDQKSIMVSVIIPTYNRAKLLNRAIQSVLKQTYDNLELIIVDDNSDDDTDALIASIKDDRLCYIKHDANKGASAARNTGIKRASGEYIAFLDSDDEWLTTKLEEQVSVMRNAPGDIGLVYCWMSHIGNDERVLRTHHSILKGYVFDKILHEQILCSCSCLLMRREVIDKVGMFDESLWRGNDNDFIRRVCRKYHVDLVPKILVKYYVDHNDRISSDLSDVGYRRLIYVYNDMLCKFKDDIERMPKIHASILHKLSFFYIALDDMEEARKLLWKAIRIDPVNILGWCKYGFTCIGGKTLYTGSKALYRWLGSVLNKIRRSVQLSV